MTHPGSVERGFTLIEVLVALALMALIATMLIASLELGGHSWQRVTRLATRQAGANAKVLSTLDVEPAAKKGLTARVAEKLRLSLPVGIHA